MKTPTIYLLAGIFLLCLSCNPKILSIKNSDNPAFRYAGRVDFTTEGEGILIGAASSVSFAIDGDSCYVGLKNGPNGSAHNFVVFEVDGDYQGRFKVEGDSLSWLSVPITEKGGSHVITVYKATEAAIGDILFAGTKVFGLRDLPQEPELKIEFIGNSITCGMGVDLEEVPCGEGEWYDQHNAYLAYGPRIARALEARFMLSSVSGIGMYRTWNMEEPSMPAVYENRYLNTDSTKQWDFNRFTPDIVSICLATNDFSEGDEEHERQPFSEEKFITTYINFVNTLYGHYPNAQLVLLSSPVFEEAKNELLMKCLQEIQDHFNSKNPQKPIQIYEFHDIVGHGCTGHPDKDDQQQMAEQLFPFFQSLL
ncbi:SGNH/GDSL hydrolase family protein [Mangrovibacterium lignilyticum]|uniref:SGNH/GDSL hydrolase family protein n=1 Tax=Mangrovibacterium lignilyticum TaxID=2668052 RepID=UPI0013D115C6|nr:SGNH/GDSL hydrolase family protein [Mangrovibacterium lignilyticum]